MKRTAAIALLIAFMMLIGGCAPLIGWMLEFGEQEKDASALPTLPLTDKSLIPLDVLTGFAEYTPPQVSADGAHLLFRYMDDYSDEVVVMDWKTGDMETVNWPSEAAGIPRFTWAPDGQTVLFFVDSMGDENYGLYTSDTENGKTATLLRGGEDNCYYVSENPNDDNQIYIAILSQESSAYDLYLMDYTTGEKQLVLENPGDIKGYHIDHDGRLRMVTRTDDHAGQHVWLRGSGKGSAFIESEWQKILSWDYEDADTSGVFGFMKDNKRVLFVDSMHTNTSSLCTYDIETQETVTVFNDPNYDIYSSWTDLELNEVTAVTIEGQKIDWHVLHESFEDDYEALSAIGDVFEIVGSSEDDAYWVVMFHSDVKEADYYIYDMEQNKAEFLFNARPSLNDYTFAPMEPFSFAASDGLSIEGYVTFPVDSDKCELPTVVMVHGGPWARDSWGFNFETQLLANRGYAVLQVNFRGSSGYGKAFMRAGDREWGGKMHQDILDAVDYAVAQGWTDADRVGVYGASYGGYEALISAAFSSDVFACAIDAFGPSSLITLIESLPPQWSTERQSFLRAVGDPDTDEEFMKSRSPLYHADKIEIPLLIAQGGNDVRVVQRESDQMVEALEDAGIPVEYLLFPSSGHGFNSYEDMRKFYSTLETFLAEHLK